ncbi:MAG: tetratricopeptide repeat protein [Nostocaceae cyanobacterium]|nr:tetratricopeptide repeat protein [Nostocaceae cyanobacterium]
MIANNQNQNLNPNAQNQDAYDDLIVSIEAGEGKLSLLIAVCDYADLKNQIIDCYEKELQPHFRSYRAVLNEKEPNLKAAIQELVEKSEYLQQHQPAVITVTGTEKLFFLKLGEEQSAQEKFFGYLQWTREGLREFPFAIILWVTHQLMVHLIKKAPDFWGWRNGVFRFVSHSRNVISGRDVEGIRFALTGTELESFNSDSDYFLPIEDLQRLIQQIEQQSAIKDAKLASLYTELANIYEQRLDRGEAEKYQKELGLAIEYWCKALELQKELGLEEDYARSLNNLALLYKSQGKYEQAEPLYLQALELTKSILGENHPNYARSLNNLAGLYYSQRKYEQAEPLFLQALELTKSILGENHPDYARSLNNLAGLYSDQGKYEQAEPLFLQALELTKSILGENYPDYARSLNNLAGLYKSQGKYEQAEPLFLQALELTKSILGENHPDYANSLNNLAGLYKSQGKYEQAEPLYLQALEIFEQQLGTNHPHTVIVRENLENLRSR